MSVDKQATMKRSIELTPSKSWQVDEERRKYRLP